MTERYQVQWRTADPVGAWNFHSKSQALEETQVWVGNYNARTDRIFEYRIVKQDSHEALEKPEEPAWDDRPNDHRCDKVFGPK